MKITLAEALPLRAAIMRRITELVQERKDVSTVKFLPDQKVDYPARTVDEITEEIRKARRDFRQLDLLMAQANVTHTLEWEGRGYAIMEAIELAKQMRSEIAELKALAGRKKETVETDYGNTAYIIRALYDPEEMRKKAIDLERRVTRLSQLIDKKNYQVEIDFPGAESYIG